MRREQLSMTYCVVVNAMVVVDEYATLQSIWWTDRRLSLKIECPWPLAGLWSMAGGLGNEIELGYLLMV